MSMPIKMLTRQIELSKNRISLQGILERINQMDVMKKPVDEFINYRNIKKTMSTREIGKAAISRVESVFDNFLCALWL